MKRRKLLSLFSVLAFVLSVQFSVLGASGPGAEDAPADMSGTALNAQEREAFHRNVADDEAFIHLVTTAAEHKGRDVSLEGVHPDKCLYSSAASDVYKRQDRVPVRRLRGNRKDRKLVQR